MQSKRWVVARASGGDYDPSCFRMEAHDSPPLNAGQLRIRTQLFSLDPTHLNWIKLDPQLQYVPIGLGDAMAGTNIGVVVESNHPDFVAGQTVTGIWRWEQVAVADAAFVHPALPEAVMPLEEQLTILSHVGQAAAGGMYHVGNVRAEDRVLVSGAAGATGAIAAQIAKAIGCFVVGIAGGAEKCRHLTDELGLDAAIDYRGEDVGAALKRHFPGGIDLFFDNVGGDVLDAALANMAQHCRIAVCGAVAQYDRLEESGFGGIRNLPLIIFRQARIEGYLAGMFSAEQNRVSVERLMALYEAGKLKTRTHSVPFAQMPEALTLLLSGRNEGKLMATAA